MLGHTPIGTVSVGQSSAAGGVSRLLAATVGGAVSVSRVISKSIGTTALVVPFLYRGFFRSLNCAVTLAASLTNFVFVILGVKINILDDPRFVRIKRRRQDSRTGL